ncbi:Ldh family oxidoreductase [Robertmurraya yapensis]|uniref:Ldh family oxidoreductase n=2 Tax=Bacillaceae TaxID=186817 RepID=A0A431W3B8_9BACI|nr:Ldh family oxidoreductase [Bacillus yapensis]RTR29949.1 Ldh family oxidoreductase [Bacillus yapensis]TKS95030.1 Ldh family oxidoreductase [Bacillus yapensis]
MSKDKYFSHEKLKSLVQSIFTNIGLNQKDANVIADHLVLASLRGVDSHGLSRVPIYVKRIKEGLVDIHGQVKITHETPSSTLIDGDNLPGILVAQTAIELAVKKAKTSGIAMIGTKNSNHCGMLGAYALYAVKHNMIAFLTSNASPSMAPWGGMGKFFGTNPFCYGVPAGQEQDIILDMATSVVAKGKIRLAEKKQVQIPEDWAITKDGKRTTDPTEALDGLVLPMAGPKGYGLVLLNDILSGVFTGANYGPYISSMFEQKIQGVGHFFVVMRPDLFQTLDTFKDKIDRYITEIRRVRRMEGIDRIYLPGEIERDIEEKRRIEGIPLTASLLDELNKISSELNIHAI